MNSNVGIHIRLVSTLKDVIDKAIRLNVPFFQTFLILTSGKYAYFEANDINEFLKLRRKFFNELYIHGSYWINLCNEQISAYRILRKEILLAKKLEFSHIVLHPGAAASCNSKQDGIEILARALNKILKEEKNIKIVLENTAHGNLSIGGDITDFATLLNLLDTPEEISFCIDTAHAYSFGYNIADLNEQQKFIELVDQNITLEKISLIHLNDTNEICGSKIDKHAIPGEGNIGKNALQNFLNQSRFKNIPVLIEPPILDENIEKEILDEINKW